MRDLSKRLLVGFSRVDITPENGVAIEGYFIPRHVEGVLDRLEVNTMALAMNGEKVIIACMDVCQIKQVEMDIFREAISKDTGVPVKNIYLTVTHTHTGPWVFSANVGELELKYFDELKQYLVNGARLALDDLKPASMGWKVSKAPGIAFGRRYKMKDGSVKTNPGVGNPDIVASIGEMDDRVNVLRFDREGGETIIVANYGNHADTIGGNLVSADWPGFMRRTVERTLPNTKCFLLNGMEGDVGSVSCFWKDGDLNNMELQFDDVMRGYAHARHMGNVVAGAILQVYEKVNYVDVDSIACEEKVIHIASNMPDPSEMELAHKYHNLHIAGKDEEIPYKGMMLTTVVAEAQRMVTLEHGPEYYDMKLSCIRIGNVALIGLPGEPFTGVGLEVKKAEGWDLVLPTCNTNGAEGYFPMMDAYEQGGYESRSSYFKAGVAEYLIDECKELLDTMKK